jgi:hypothetical protein
LTAEELLLLGQETDEGIFTVSGDLLQGSVVLLERMGIELVDFDLEIEEAPG